MTYRVRTMGQSHVVARGGGVGVIAGGRVDVVLVDVAEFLIHGVVVDGLALVGFLLPLEIARAHELMIRLVGDHGVAPPVVHRPQVVVVVIRHRIAYLQYICIYI